MTSPRVLVVNNGTLSLNQLCRRFEALGAVADPVHVTELPARLDGRYQALALSGTKVRAFDGGFYRRLIGLVTESSVPVFGICGGMQIIGTAAGAELKEGGQRVGAHEVQLKTDDPLFAHARPTVSLFQRHTLYLQDAPPGFRTIGWSQDAPVEFIRSEDGRVYGSQAHLEFRRDGLDILRGFVDLIG
ncbi:type 1 glutamine amidotransferase [Kitasatospora sp. NPDC054939]